MAKRTQLYFHKTTGNICYATKKQATSLGPNWSKVEFVKNQKGEDVMRFNFDGAVVDVQENGQKEVVLDGNANTN